MPKPALLIIDHGSRRAAANEALERLAERLQTELGDAWIVRCAHMEIASPDIAEAFASCVNAGAEEIIVHPFMLSPGRHVTEDIPRLVQEAAEPHSVPYTLTAPLGASPDLVHIVAAVATSTHDKQDS